MAVTTNLEMYVGEDRTFEITPDITPIPDITAWTLQFDIKASKDVTVTALITKTNGSGITITNGPTGTFTVTISKTDTISALGVVLLSPGLYWWDVSRIDPGQKRVLGVGQFRVLSHTVKYT